MGKLHGTKYTSVFRWTISKTKLIILTIIFSPKISTAQIEPKFEGYFYDLPSVTSIPELYKSTSEMEVEDDYMFSNTTRLRLKPEINIGYNGRFTLHYEVSANYSKYLFQKPSTGITNRQAIDLNWEMDSGDDYYISHFIDRLYYKHIFDFGEITFGRQNVSYGVGRIWQPTDKFNPLNPANFSKFEKDGADAVRAKIYFGNFTDLDVVYNIRDEFDKSNYAVRLRTNWKEYDFSILGGWFDDDYSIGGDFAGNLLGAGLRGELVYANNHRIADSSYIRAIIGADYQFSDKLYGLIEFQYNGQGTTCKFCYLSQFEKVFRGEMQNVGVYYGAVQTTYQIHPLVGLSVINITNIGDGSGFVSLNAAWSAKDWLDISLAGMINYGDELTEYSYYSSAGYLMIQTYF